MLVLFMNALIFYKKKFYNWKEDLNVKLLGLTKGNFTVGWKCVCF